MSINQELNLPVAPGAKKKKGCRARPFRPADRVAVRHICCETGFMGKPVDPLYSDREAFADFFTGYYTDFEPEYCLVAESVAGEVVGYILIATDFKRYPARQARVVLRTIPSVVWKILTGRYGKSDFAFLSWLLRKAGKETPEAPKQAAHFHINILPEWRGEAGRHLLIAFLKAMPQWGIGLIYGQMQIYQTRRAGKLFERFGFQVYDKREVTKFERFGVKGVQVATLVRDFSATENQVA
ncbi:hypothetical protein P4C99_15180 [Pontiellaceae bacterium B1224]|nr:hypothetical protein [Pontiellaceae bacterium B1224]